MKVRACLYSFGFVFQRFVKLVMGFHQTAGVWRVPLLKRFIPRFCWHHKGLLRNWAFKGLRVGVSALTLLLEVKGKKELLVQNHCLGWAFFVRTSFFLQCLVLRSNFPALKRGAFRRKSLLLLLCGLHRSLTEKQIFCLEYKIYRANSALVKRRCRNDEPRGPRDELWVRILQSPKQKLPYQRSFKSS